jgi:hypothetical protein
MGEYVMSANATWSRYLRVRSLIVLIAVFAIPRFTLAQTTPCASGYTPPGAQSLGYTRVFCVVPSLSDITTESNPSYKLYSGNWYSANPTPMSFYSMSGSTLVIHLGGGLMTETKQSQPAALPLLLASSGFYAEFQVSLSSNDQDHFPAVWLMPQEHDGHKDDHSPADPGLFERWMELDVDEGGYSPNGGMHGTMISWSGTYPNYQNQKWSVSTSGMDRTQYHVFGLSYDPQAQRVTWWLDGTNVGSASSQAIPSIINSYHYYLIMGAQTHGAHKPYDMYVRYFGAWAGGVVPMPPSNVKMSTP